MDVLIPSLGDIDQVEVIEICISVGDDIDENDGIIVIESDKASMEVPSPSAGRIDEICVSLGDLVSEGVLVAKIENPEPRVSDVKPEARAPDTNSEKHDTKEGRSLDVLVPSLDNSKQAIVADLLVLPGQVIRAGGELVVLETDEATLEVTSDYSGAVIDLFIAKGDVVGEGDLMARISPSQVAEPIRAHSEQRAEEAQESQTENKPTSSSEGGGSDRVYAGPAVRRLAREYGILLDKVEGSGLRGRIMKDDLKAFVKLCLSDAPEVSRVGGLPQVDVVDFSRFGQTGREELSRIQKLGAKNLYASWVNVPHVTQHDKVDVTELENFRQSINLELEKGGSKVTPLAFIVRACCVALAKYPRFNASLAKDQESILVNRFFNIGFAVDTEEGLVVPVIKGADKKGIRQLSTEILDLSERTRLKRLGMDDLQGGTFTVSSLGALGGTGFTPIVNAPQLAILGVARMDTEPVWDGEKFLPRKVLPLSLSYDHRVINGADGGRFMNFLTRLLADIRRFSL